jgi:hypothetical protein
LVKGRKVDEVGAAGGRAVAAAWEGVCVGRRVVGIAGDLGEEVKGRSHDKIR